MRGAKQTISAAAARGTTLISCATEIRGTINFSGNLDIEGTVHGEIVAQPKHKATVRIIGKGRVEGNIHASIVMINGTMQGDVHASDHLELAPAARVEGNLYYQSIAIKSGAEINGKLHCHSEKLSRPVVLPRSPGKPATAVEGS